MESHSAVAPVHNLYVTVWSFNLFTITDGAIRSIILLYANKLGFNAILIAVMFSMYELAGVFTNLFGGVIATRYGLKFTLLCSLVCQVVGLGLLLTIEPIFGDLETMTNKGGATAFITFCQALSGIAKDLMKLSCKSMPKLVSKPGDDDKLFVLVAWVTGLKNSFKGFGSIVGAILINFTSLVTSVCVLLGIIGLIVPAPILYMDKFLGMNKKNAVFNLKVLQKGRDVNVLSLARFFLFGARDIWYEIAAPLFLSQALLWSDWTVGLFLGGYTIVYGFFQTSVSKLFKKSSKENLSSLAKVFNGLPPVSQVKNWAYGTAAQLVVWSCILYPLYRHLINTGNSDGALWGINIVFVFGVLCFAILFAVNSAVHSYFIVRYAGKDKLAMDMGFYYMANAGGRLVGTLLSGVIYYYTEKQFGLSVPLWSAGATMIAAGFVAIRLEEPATEMSPPIEPQIKPVFDESMNESMDSSTPDEISVI